ncbi:MAG TPA: 5-oxoprolinase subunit PxpB [Anaerolineales bacterium]
MLKNISHLGDSSLLIHFGDDIDLALNLRVHTLDARLQSSPNRPAGILEMVPAYATLLIHYDPLVLTCDQVTGWLEEEMAVVEEAAARKPRRIEVPVRYGGEGGPDLAFVASMHQTTPAAIVRLHTGREYTVFMMGFTPGFPYLGRLDDALVTPRLETPRTRVPAGSVGIAGAQTGIYPIDSPGGWRLIGHTSLTLFDLGAPEPFLFTPGDTVRFLMESLHA